MTHLLARQGVVTRGFGCQGLDIIRATLGEGEGGGGGELDHSLSLGAGNADKWSDGGGDKWSLMVTGVS